MIRRLVEFLKQLFKNRPLAKELSIVLTVKFVLLYILWALFFAHPVSETLTRQGIAQHLFPTRSVQSGASSSSANDMVQKRIGVLS